VDAKTHARRNGSSHTRSTIIEVSVSLSVPQYAEAIFSLTDRNRDFLRQWLPGWMGPKPPGTRNSFSSTNA